MTTINNENNYRLGPINENTENQNLQLKRGDEFVNVVTSVDMEPLITETVESVFGDVFSTTIGHDHNGVNSKLIDHINLINKGTNTHSQIDVHIASANSHITNIANPHSVTATQIGLGNVNNTSDLDKPISTAQGIVNTMLQAVVIPIRGIIMWAGTITNIPTGFALCNGQTVNSITTPNLSGKFIVGYSNTDTDYNTIGKTGGEKTHTLTQSELPHVQIGNGMQDDAKVLFTHGGKTLSGSLVTGSIQSEGNTPLYEGLTDYIGNGQSHENRPPYYTLAYIMRVE